MSWKRIFEVWIMFQVTLFEGLAVQMISDLGGDARRGCRKFDEPS